jgi:hypothetical protein
MIQNTLTNLFIYDDGVSKNEHCEILSTVFIHDRTYKHIIRRSGR